MARGGNFARVRPLSTVAADGAFDLLQPFGSHAVDVQPAASVAAETTALSQYPRRRALFPVGSELNDAVGVQLTTGDGVNDLEPDPSPFGHDVKIARACFGGPTRGEVPGITGGERSKARSHQRLSSRGRSLSPHDRPATRNETLVRSTRARKRLLRGCHDPSVSYSRVRNTAI